MLRENIWKPEDGGNKDNEDNNIKRRLRSTLVNSKDSLENSKAYNILESQKLSRLISTRILQ